VCVCVCGVCVCVCVCVCVVKPLVGQTVQTWHSLACAVKTEDKTVRLCVGGGLRIRNLSDERCRENHNPHFMFTNYFRKIVPFMTYAEKYGTDGQATDHNKISFTRFVMLDD